ncbi:hypothetical protein AHAS_Ahas02G0098000 [Arachis hypogaea]
MFSADQPLPWDVENNYKRDFVELYYEAGSGVRLSKEKLLHCLLEGTAASHVGDEEKDAVEDFKHSAGSPKWIKVNEKKMLQDILKEPNFVIPEIPDLAIKFNRVMYLQSSMLFPSNPAFIASSNLENGLLQAYESKATKEGLQGSY